MKKGVSLVGLILVVVCVICVIAFFNKGTEEVVPEGNEVVENVAETAISVESASDLELLVNELYENNIDLYPSLANQAIDVTDADSVKYMTGLENGDKLQYLVVSEPMMSSQAYSLVIAKVKDGVDADAVAKEMSENIDTRKWICVSAEKLYATSSGDIVFLVMSSEEMAKPVYNSFKAKAVAVGQEYEKTEVVEELPEDMY